MESKYAEARELIRLSLQNGLYVEAAATAAHELAVLAEPVAVAAERLDDPEFDRALVVSLMLAYYLGYQAGMFDG